MRLLEIGADRFVVELTGAECELLVKGLGAIAERPVGPTVPSGDGARCGVLFQAFSSMHGLARAVEQSQKSTL